MRLCRFDDGDGASVGLVKDGAVSDPGAAAPGVGTERALALAACPGRILEVAGWAPARA